MRWQYIIRAPARAFSRGLKAFSMLWSGSQWPRTWWFPLRTKFNYAKEVGDGRGSSIVVAVVSWMARTFPEAPAVVVAEKDDGTRERLSRHDLKRLIARPNPFYSGVLLWMATIIDWALDGNAYWLKVRSRADRVVQLWYAPSFTIEPKWPADGQIFISHYDYKPDPTKGPTRIEPRDVVHFRYLVDPANVRKGQSQLRSVLREIFTDEEAANLTASLMRNLGVPGVVVAPDVVGTATSEEQANQVKEDFMEKFGGDRRGEPMVMTAPTKVQVLSFSPEQMELTKIRRIPEERVSAVFGVAAIVAGLGAGLERSTFQNFAEAREAAYEGNIIPTQRLMAADLTTQLLPDFDQDPAHEVEFDLSHVRVLQPDMDKLYERSDRAVRGGWFTVGDALREVGKPAGPEHDIYLRSPLQVAVPRAASGAKHLKAASGPELRRRVAESFRPVFADAFKRIVERERRELLAAAERLLAGQAVRQAGQDRQRFTAWLEGFYEEHGAFVREQAAPAFASYAETLLPVAAIDIGADGAMTPELEAFLADYVAGFDQRWTTSSRGQLAAVVRDAEDPLAAVRQRVDEWEERRPSKDALRETVQASGALAVTLWAAHGVTTKVWVASGKNCPYCTKLDGNRVGISAPFLEGGRAFQPEGADRPLVPSISRAHPPAHAGCDCGVSAGF